jgi:hypothetical protein
MSLVLALALLGQQPAAKSTQPPPKLDVPVHKIPNVDPKKVSVAPQAGLSQGARIRCFRKPDGQVVWQVTDKTGVHELPWHEVALGTDYVVPPGTPEGTSLFKPRKVNDERVFDKNGKPVAAKFGGQLYPLNEYGGMMWWAPIGRPDLHVTPPSEALTMGPHKTTHFNPPIPVEKFFKRK